MNEITYYTTDENNVVYTVCFGIEPDGEVVLYDIIGADGNPVDASEELSIKIIEYITNTTNERRIR